MIKEVQADVKKECEDEIKKILFDWAWGTIDRRITGGLAQWYKEHLLAKQFESHGSDEILPHPQDSIQARDQAQNAPHDPSDHGPHVV